MKTLRTDGGHTTPGQAARRARDLRIAAAIESGMSVRRVAGLVGLSPSRVTQIHQSLLMKARKN